MSVFKGLSFLLLVSQLAFAQASEFEKEWSGWVEDRHPAIDCPINISNEGKKVCTWPGELLLNLSGKGLTFSMPIEVFKKEAFVQLPGSLKYWPSHVSINGKKAPVIQRHNTPQLLLAKGNYVVNGGFDWLNKPSSLRLPKGVALVSLTDSGKSVPASVSSGKIFFGRQQKSIAGKERDSLRVEVYRLLTDGVPVKLESRIKLSVSGKSREVVIGRLSIEGTEITNIDANLPLRIEDDGNMRIQVRPGEHHITVSSRFVENPLSIKIDNVAEAWPEFEYLSFKSNTDIRQAKLSGAVSIDTSQVAIPYDWQQLPTYRLSNSTELLVETEQRGDKASASNQLQVRRGLWLDFDGKALTSLDKIDGKMTQGWRLNAQEDTQVGRATVSEKPVLITEDKGKKGIEIRSADINVSAVSRIFTPSDFSAIGWHSKADSYAATLHLPPGWRVLFAGGVDDVSGVWLKRWDLWDVFLVLVLIAATHKLMGIKVSSLAAITLLVTYHENGSPVVIWPVLLLAISLLPIIKNKLYRVTSIVAILASAMLVFLVISFAISAFRLTLYPSLERHSVSYYDQSYSSYSEGRSVKKAKPKLERKMQQAKSKSVATMSVLQDSFYEEAPVRQKNMYEVDDSDRIQTGPGMPRWMWSSVHLKSSGPVTSGQKIKVIYCPPILTGLWRILSVLLMSIFAFVLFLRLAMLIKVERFTSLNTASAASILPVLLVGLLMLGPDVALAKEYPPEYLLEELDKKISKKPVCKTQCVSQNNVKLTVNKDTLNLLFDVYAETDVALQLPTWQWLSVLVDGKPAALKKVQGSPYMLVRKGHHKVVLTGAVKSEQFTLMFPVPMHNFMVTAPLWTVDGLVDNRLPNNTLNFSAKADVEAKKSDALIPDPIKPFVIVRRELLLEKQWQLITVVERLAPFSGAITVNVPLLEGEKVLSDIHIKNGLATVQLGINQHSKRWRSSFEPKPAIELIAVDHEGMLETWRVRPSSLWRLEYQGIPPVKESGDISSLQPLWKPWPGEKLKLTVDRPGGISGPVQTVESAELEFDAGKKLQKSTLILSVRSSQGESYEVELPNDAEVLKITVDGKSLNIPEGNRVKLQLTPGLQNIRIEFQQEAGLGLVSKTPQVILPGSSTNIEIQYKLPRDRWPLYLSGPDIGPAMLYWGVLCVILIAAVVLSILAKEIKLNIPVRLVDWLLLGVGLSTINGYGVIFVALFFFVLALRKQRVQPEQLSRAQFNSMQFCIVILTLAAVVSLISAIPMGLLSTPNMKVVGNGSYSYLYHFYQDRATPDGFPQATIVSVSLMTYRLVMLAWSLWLATRLITWAQWWWHCFSEKGAWKDKISKEDRE